MTVYAVEITSICCVLKTLHNAMVPSLQEFVDHRGKKWNCCGSHINPPMMQHVKNTIIFGINKDGLIFTEKVFGSYICCQLWVVCTLPSGEMSPELVLPHRLPGKTNVQVVIKCDLFTFLLIVVSQISTDHRLRINDLQQYEGSKRKSFEKDIKLQY